MSDTDSLRYTKLALNNLTGAIPALGFGTLIPDPVATNVATKGALEAGFRLIDTAERYRTEKQVGDAMQDVFNAGEIRREDDWLVRIKVRKSPIRNRQYGHVTNNRRGSRLIRVV